MFKRFSPKSPDPNINKNADSTPVKFGHINALIDYINDVPPGAGIASVTGDIVDDTDPLNPVVNTPTLQQVSDAGGLTNNSTLREGTIDHGYGGGISRLCANNKDDQWEDGVRYIIHDTGGFKTVVYVENSNGVNPSSYDDETLSYVIGSKWKNLVTGVEYFCINTNTGEAVWVPSQGTLSDFTESTSLQTDGLYCTSGTAINMNYVISANIITIYLKALLNFNLIASGNGWFSLLVLQGTQPTVNKMIGTGSFAFQISSQLYPIVIADSKAWLIGGGSGAENVEVMVAYSYEFIIK
jgi:hypothetical protein